MLAEGATTAEFCAACRRTGRTDDPFTGGRWTVTHRRLETLVCAALLRTCVVVLSQFRPRRLVVPAPLLSRLRAHVTEQHPRAAGGYLVCEWADASLRAVDTVRLDNESDRPLWQFETTVDDAPAMPRVFYHSHTTPASPSGLTKPDRKVTERFQLVVFAPGGEPGSYRLFHRGVFNWREFVVEVDSETGWTRLP